MRHADRVVRAAAIAATLASIAFLFLEGLGAVPLLLAGTAMAAIADACRIRILDGRASSLALAPALGIAFLSRSPAIAIVGFALGTTITARIRRERLASATSLLALAGASTTFLLVPSVLLVGDPRGAQLSLLGVTVAAGVALAADGAIRWVRLPARSGRSFRTTIRALAPLHLAIASAAGLFALSEPVLGAWAYPLFLAPLGATQHAFTQLIEIRRTFGQTIDALAKIPEIAGYSRPGHAERVARLSVAVAVELDLDPKSIEELTIAAQLHDIGRMRAASPERLLETSPAELASAGAAVVRATGVLPRVAIAIERQHEAFRLEGARSDRTLPIASRIIRVASAFDELAAAGTGAVHAERALARLAAQAGTTFDPQVIAALETLIERADSQTLLA